MLWDWSAESITAIGTVALAVIALVVAVFEGRAMRKHNQLSVQPLLNIIKSSRYGDGVATIDFQLENLGIGPAIVKKFVIFFDDEEFVMPKGMKKFELQMKIKFILRNVRIKEFEYTSAIGVGKDTTILALEIETATETEEEIDKLADHFGFKIEYQSIHKDETFSFSITNALGYPEKPSLPKKNQKEKKHD